MTSVQVSDGMKTRRVLADAASSLRPVLQDETIVEGTPIEATTALSDCGKRQSSPRCWVQGGSDVREGGFHCRQCGHCCLNLGDAIATCASEADVRRWEAAGRDDILAWVDPIAVGEERVYDIWVNPKTGEDVQRCPWLRKVRGTDRFLCRIHDLKPEHCRKYPKSRRHAEETGCAMERKP